MSRLNRRSFEAAQGVRSYPLDRDTILFDSSSGRLFVLNESAAFIWNGLTSGLSPEDVAAELAGETGAQYDAVIQHCDDLVSEWINAGLTNASAPVPANPTDSSEPRAAETAANATNAVRSYRVADVMLTFVGTRASLEVVDRLLGHCLIEPGSKSEQAQVFLLATRKRGWSLIYGNRVLGECDDLWELAPLVHAAVMHFTYTASESFVAIHGSAVSRGNECVLFPGIPGAGKSTLTAALVTSGLGYCTDDLAMLTGGPLCLRAMPTCIGLKEGSWPILAPRLPEISALPVYKREDGQLVKYLLPPADRMPRAGNDRFTVKAVVFPQYEAGSACERCEIPRSAALVRIADSGYHLEGELDEAWVTTTLGWLQTLDCYELRYSSLDDAVEAVADLLA